MILMYKVIPVAHHLLVNVLNDEAAPVWNKFASNRYSRISGGRHLERRALEKAAQALS